MNLLYLRPSPRTMDQKMSIVTINDDRRETSESSSVNESRHLLENESNSVSKEQIVGQTQTIIKFFIIT